MNKKIFFVLFINLLCFFSVSCSNRKLALPDDMVVVPAGEFIMGSNDIKIQRKKESYESSKPLYADEYPEQKVFLNVFFIDKYEVSNEKFWKFNQRYIYPAGKDNYPVTNVNWFSAERYCKTIGRRLPTEEEWEKAARGPTGNVYPWGNEFKKGMANVGDKDLKETTPVGIFENGKSYYGVYDLIGNVGEWTGSWYKAYLGSDYKSDDFGERKRVIRGSSWGGVGHYKLNVFNRSSFRRSAGQGTAIPDVGFRCALSP